MIIDLILDRRDGVDYNARSFYHDVNRYAATFDSEVMRNIARAMDEGTAQDVRRALCEYIKANEYNVAICDYVNAVNWLE